MSILPAALLEQIRLAIKRPEGSVTFQLHSPDLLDATKPGGYLFELAAGDHVFRLERSSDLIMNFYHGSPGTGTRIASIDLRRLSASERFFVALTWSPAGTTLYVGGHPRGPGEELLSAEGETTRMELRVGADGSIYQVGDEDVDIMGISVFQRGQPVLTPTALGAWRGTKQAVELLQNAQSDEGFMFEVVVANLTIATLVTGLENYAKTRFLEVEREGIAPDVQALIRAFTTKREREANIADVLAVEAAEARVSLLQYFVARGGINFQNYGQLKRSFSRAYGIRFGSIDVASTELALLKQYIQYRHRIIHVSPLTAWLNQPESPPQEPVFAKKETSGLAIVVFDEFISKLHAATLVLRPNG